ncbi:N-acetylmuramidase domain-containing protein [Chelatococcus reniformis]|uniref:Peptidoglycan-binding protein n=1 Tax=Chelatococcus reniformis TaxID=1494448 RepID=A0A916UG23_9HYPH|nr:N-acetylmuramidase domain-containing protein [Chelatococcus reniformis]GGC70994.1 hypothetical protein GCM10010994_31900 [Chelatococcus reniformis]
MQFVGSATKLADIDLPRLGSLIGVGEDEIHAVLDVESRGSGFDAQKRPRILFEPHVFYRNLSGSRRDAAVKAGLAAKSWGAIPYGGESAQYGRLERAIAIDETAALKSASYGLGQILGENFVVAGYDSPQEMVEDMVNGGEAAHLGAMVNFIKANNLDDELRTHNWAGFARGYNGSGYAKNGYHTKLAAAYAKWARIPDTPWQPDALPPPANDAMPATVRRGDKGLAVERLQTELNRLGYGLKVDMDFGLKTLTAAKSFQGKAGLNVDGVVGPVTWRALLSTALVATAAA